MSYVIVATADDGSVSVHGMFRAEATAERWAESTWGPGHGMTEDRVAWACMLIERPER